MFTEISVTSVGAVFLVVLLLLILSCASNRRDKFTQRDYKGSSSSGKNAFIHFCTKLYDHVFKSHENIMMN